MTTTIEERHPDGCAPTGRFIRWRLVDALVCAYRVEGTSPLAAATIRHARAELTAHERSVALYLAAAELESLSELESWREIDELKGRYLR